VVNKCISFVLVITVVNKCISFVLVITFILTLITGCSNNALRKDADLEARNIVLEQMPESIKNEEHFFNLPSYDKLLWDTDSSIVPEKVVVAFIFKAGNKADLKTIANPELFVVDKKNKKVEIVTFRHWKDVKGIMDISKEFQMVKEKTRELHPDWWIEE